MFSIKRNKILGFALLYLYLILVAFVVVQFNLSLYSSTALYLFFPALYGGCKMRREGRMVWESVIISIPAICIVDLMGHMSGSWDYWRSEVYGIWFGPYPLIGFFWGFSFWLALASYYEYFFDKSYSRLTPPHRETIFISR